MNWLGPLAIIVAAYLIWHTFWVVFPLLVGVLLGIGLQERFPKLSGVVGVVVDNLRSPPTITQSTTKVRKRRSSTSA